MTDATRHRPRHLDPVLLQAFVAAARLGSISAAAPALHLSQATVSQQIGRLEHRLGAALFVRSAQGVVLTPFGQQALPWAQGLLRLQQRALDALLRAGPAGAAGAGALPEVLRLGLPPDLVRSHLAGLLQRFARQHPAVEIEVHSAMSRPLAAAMAAGDLDLALVQNAEPAWGGRLIGQEPLVWVGARGGRAHLKRPLNVALVGPACVFGPVLAQALAAAGVAQRVRLARGDIEATTTLVRSDLAVTAWMASTVPADLQALDPVHSGLPALPAGRLHLLAADPAALEEDGPLADLAALIIAAGVAPLPGPVPVPQATQGPNSASRRPARRRPVAGSKKPNPPASSQ